MRGSLILLSIALVALAQEAPLASGASPGTTIPSGVPIRVALERRVAIKRVGEPIQGRLVDSIYVFDRVVLPAGTLIEGHVAEIGAVPAGRRIAAILSGNFTPAREVRAQFDTLVLGDGSRLSLRTSETPGIEHTARITTRRKHLEDRKTLRRHYRDGVPESDLASIRAFTPPSQMSRLRAALLGMLPYHRQAWQAGTLFNGVLQSPLAGLPACEIKADAGPMAATKGDGQEVSARLLTAINSATARRGALVEAVVTRPLFSADRVLLIPEGSRLLGDVVEARPARSLHRNGKMSFVFRQIKLPSGRVQAVQGHLEGIEANFDSHVALDSEGAARASSPNTQFIFPALAVAAAGLSFHQDYNSKGVPDQDIGGRAESGAVGLGLIGTIVAQVSRPVASSIAFIGAGFSVYTTFIARGEDVMLPTNTPVLVSIGSRR